MLLRNLLLSPSSLFSSIHFLAFTTSVVKLFCQRVRHGMPLLLYGLSLMRTSFTWLEKSPWAFCLERYDVCYIQWCRIDCRTERGIFWEMHSHVCMYEWPAPKNRMHYNLKAPNQVLPISCMYLITECISKQHTSIAFTTYKYVYLCPPAGVIQRVIASSPNDGRWLPTMRTIKATMHASTILWIILQRMAYRLLLSPHQLIKFW